MNNLIYINWDPVNNIKIGVFTIYIYSLLFIVSFLVGYYIMINIFNNENINIELIDILFIYTIIGTIIGARLGHVLFYDINYFKNNLIEALFPIKKSNNNILLGIVKGYEFTGYKGLSSHGAAITLLIITMFYSIKIKKPFLWMCDRFCIPICLGFSLIRLGNFFNSEIVGKPSNLPWSVKFIQMNTEYGPNIPRHPTQIYESIGYIIIFIIILYLYKKSKVKKIQGFIFGIFLINIWIVRMFIEFLKEPQGMEFIKTNILNTGQILTIPFLLIGLIILLKIYLENNKIL